MKLRIRNWDRWQSYRKDRGQPPWIKIHRCIMRNPEWVDLTDAQRGQLVAIWLLAADHDGVIPASPATIRKLCFMDSEPNLKVLMEKGFIEHDATLASEWRQADAPETETETETEEEKKDHGADAPDDVSNVLQFRPSEPQPAEDEFWEIVDRESKSRRIPRAMMAQLLKLHDGDCEMALVSLKAAVKAKEPTKYLGKVLANIKGERELASAPERRDEKYPAFVRDFISEGYHVEKKANGTWRCGGSIYDSSGQVVGW